MALTAEEIKSIADVISETVVTKVKADLPEEVTKAVEAKLPDALKVALDKSDIIKSMQSKQTELETKVAELTKTESDADADADADADVTKNKDTVEKLTEELTKIIKRIDLLENTPDASAQEDEDAAAIKKKKDEDDNSFEPSGDEEADKVRKTLAGTDFSVEGLLKNIRQQ